jgi:hypothetical protein
MPLQYARHDATLIIRMQDDRTLRLDVQQGPAVNRRDVSVKSLDDPRRLTSLLAGWTPLVDAVNFANGGNSVLKRLVVRAHDRQAAGVDWELVLRGLRKPAAASNLLVVRGTDALPRSISQRFDFPARVLEIGKPQTVEDTVHRILNFSKTNFAMVVKSSDLQDAARFRETLTWATVDVVHLHPDATRRIVEEEDPDEPGSAGWLFRVTNRWQTRLLVLEGVPGHLGELRKAAQKLIDRGGPAVMVLPPTSNATTTLYAAILHDRPLDWCQQHMARGALFAGGGRPEALRFSRIGLELTAPETRKAILTWLKTNRPVTADVPKRRLRQQEVVDIVMDVGEQMNLLTGKKLRLRSYGPYERTRIIRFGDVVSNRLLDYGYALPPLDYRLSVFGGTATTPVADVATVILREAKPILPMLRTGSRRYFDAWISPRLDNLTTSLRTFEFEDQESGGTLPLAAKAAGLRRLLLWSAAKRTKPSKPFPRHVNSAFYRTDDAGELLRIEQTGARLVPGEIVHLGVSIGRKDPLTITVGDLVFADEAIKWTDEMEGVWLEIAVTHIDFDVLGEPVQEVWLPAIGESELVTFALRPRATTTVPGVARLRFTIFYRNNVVQSFRTAAALASVEGDPAAGLATALSIETPRPGGAGYLTRLEYSAVDANQASELQERNLGIVANDSAGEKILSIKGKEFFSTTINNNLPTHVEAARGALTTASRNRAGEYRYDDQNAGSESDLLAVLWDVALAGWQLLSLILPEEEKREEVRTLLGDGGTITAAHVNLGQVVPWSLIYDRPVDANLPEYSEDWEDESSPVYKVERAFCPASLPLADGTVPQVRCIDDPKCVLHQAKIEARKKAGDPILRPETVICPQHFWGFKHQIEVPVQQTEKAGTTVPPIKPAVTAEDPAQVVAGFNGTVKLSGPHLTDIKGDIATFGKAKLRTSARSARNALMQMLGKLEPDVIYLYCHAYVETNDQPPQPQPNLDFGNRAVGDIAFAADFAGAAWKHAPLVILNGCGTVGFSPAAPAEFITQFIQGRHASAVLGTEVTVWAELATELGRGFLKEFLTGTPAGIALLGIRRRLLSKGNPLGLVYTLYGSNGVHLEFRS